MAHYYLGSWIWDTSQQQPFWRTPRPDLHIASVDLRSLPQCADKGTLFPLRGLFALSAQDSSVGIYLGDNLGALVNLAKKTALKSALNLGENIIASDMLGVLLELCNRFADPTGATRWKPLTISRREGLRLQIGELYQEPFSIASPAFANTIAVFQADYRRNRPLLPLDTMRRFTGGMMRKLGASDPTAILPPEFASDGFLPPTTSAVDNFNRADGNLDGSTSSDGSFTWTEFLNTPWTVTSNAARETGATGESGARANLDMSTDDHRVQVKLVTFTFVSSTIVGGPHCRKDSTATETLYTAVTANSTPNLALYKLISGTPTQLGTNGSSLAVNDIMRVDANGSTIRALKNGVPDITQTDTAITGNLRGGLSGNLGNTGNVIDFDDFLVADVSIPLFMHHYKQLAGSY